VLLMCQSNDPSENVGRLFTGELTTFLNLSMQTFNFQAVNHQKTAESSHIISTSNNGAQSDALSSAATAVSTASRQPALPQQQDASSASGQSYRIEDFTFGRVVGAGSFGRVYIGKHRPTGQTLAIKCMSKAACIQGGQVL
jgi:hypothetical protein